MALCPSMVSRTHVIDVQIMENNKPKPTSLELDQTVLHNFAQLADGLGLVTEKVRALRSTSADTPAAHSFLMKVRPKALYDHDEPFFQMQIKKILQSLSEFSKDSRRFSRKPELTDDTGGYQEACGEAIPSRFHGR